MPGHLKAEISHTYVVKRGICPRHSDINIGHRQDSWSVFLGKSIICIRSIGRKTRRKYRNNEDRGV